MEISARHRRILEAVIELYVRSASPVGSRTVSRHVDLEWSPATIRNAMADLEEEGLLEQPHLSAGRIPTAQAFRLWIRQIRPADPSPAARRLLATAAGESDDPKIRLGRVSEVLSTLGAGAGVALAPRLDRGRLARAEFVPLGGERVLLLWVTAAGIVYHRILQVDGVDPESIGQFERLLNQEYRGHTFDEVRSRIRQDLLSMKHRFDSVVEQMLQPEAEPGEVIVEGVGRMFEHPEFGDVQLLRQLYGAFEERSSLASILERVARSGGLQVLLGDEDGLARFAGVGVVAAPYATDRDGGNALGTIGFVGPSRMAYPEVLGLVRAAAEVLSRSFDSSGNGDSEVQGADSE